MIHNPNTAAAIHTYNTNINNKENG